MARVDPGAPNQAALLFLGMNAYPSPIGPARMDDHGYWRICIRVKDGCWKIRYLHRLIYEQAHGPIPRDHDIHHCDGDKGNCSLSSRPLKTAHIIAE